MLKVTSVSFFTELNCISSRQSNIAQWTPTECLWFRKKSLDIVELSLHHRCFYPSSFTDTFSSFSSTVVDVDSTVLNFSLLWHKMHSVTISSSLMNCFLTQTQPPPSLCNYRPFCMFAYCCWGFDCEFNTGLVRFRTTRFIIIRFHFQTIMMNIVLAAVSIVAAKEDLRWVVGMKKKAQELSRCGQALAHSTVVLGSVIYIYN